MGKIFTLFLTVGIFCLFNSCNKQVITEPKPIQSIHALAREGEDSSVDKTPKLRDFVIVPSGNDTYLDLMDYDGTIHHNTSNYAISHPIVNPNLLGGLPEHFPGGLAITGLSSIDWDINKIALTIRNNGLEYIALASYNSSLFSYVITSVKKLTYSTLFQWSIHHIEADTDPSPSIVYGIVSCIPNGQTKFNNIQQGGIVEIDYSTGFVSDVVSLPFSGDFQGLDWYFPGAYNPNGSLTLFKWNYDYKYFGSTYHGAIFNVDLSNGSYTTVPLGFIGSIGSTPYGFYDDYVRFYSSNLSNPLGSIFYPCDPNFTSDYNYNYTSSSVIQNTNGTNVVFYYGPNVIVNDATVAY